MDGDLSLVGLRHWVGLGWNIRVSVDVPDIFISCHFVNSFQYFVYLFCMYYGIFVYIVCQLSIYNNFSLKDNKYLYYLIYNFCLKDIKFMYCLVSTLSLKDIKHI